MATGRVTVAEMQSVNEGEDEHVEIMNQMVVKFACKVDVEELASTVQGDARSVRSRVATGCVSAADVQALEEEEEAEKSVKFAAENDVEEVLLSGQARDVRSRVATGRVTSADVQALEEEEENTIKFASKDDVEEVYPLLGSELKNVRSRVATGRVTAADVQALEEEEKDTEGKSVKFVSADDVEDVPAILSGKARNVRSRIATGCVTIADIQALQEEEEHEVKTIKFASTDDVEVVTPFGSGQLKNVRSRVATGRVTAADMHALEESDDDDDEEMQEDVGITEHDSAWSTGVLGAAAQPVRSRIVTGHVTTEASGRR